MPLTATGFDWVAQMLQRESAIVLAPGKEYLVEARLAPIARQQGLGTVGALVESLRSRRDSALTRSVVEALTTNETSWLRDSDPFTGLVDTVLPALCRKRSPSEQLRVWSAACSSGQEAYTIAMLACEAMPDATSRLKISASDISRAMVERTREGRFSQLEVNRGLPAQMLVKHFTRAGTDWQVSPALRSMVDAFECNLAAPLPPLPAFDVIFLRNVLIYFDVATKRAILRSIRKRLKPDGWLFLGAAESVMGIDDTWHRQQLGRTSVFRPTIPHEGA